MLVFVRCHSLSSVDRLTLRLQPRSAAVSPISDALDSRPLRLGSAHPASRANCSLIGFSAPPRLCKKLNRLARKIEQNVSLRSRQSIPTLGAYRVLESGQHASCGTVIPSRQSIQASTQKRAQLVARSIWQLE